VEGGATAILNFHFSYAQRCRILNVMSEPLTKEDLQKALDQAITRMERFVLDREIGMLWKFLLLGLALLGAQWAAITWMMAHWKP
jgi:hypothetical protein